MALLVAAVLVVGVACFTFAVTVAVALQRWPPMSVFAFYTPPDTNLVWFRLAFLMPFVPHFPRHLLKNPCLFGFAGGVGHARRRRAKSGSAAGKRMEKTRPQVRYRDRYGRYVGRAGCGFGEGKSRTTRGASCHAKALAIFCLSLCSIRGGVNCLRGGAAGLVYGRRMTRGPCIFQWLF